jgi:hypothetical protein
MSVTQTQRILDLALAGHPVDQIAHALNVTEAVVETALQDFTATPSGQGGGGSSSQTVAGDLSVGGKLGVNGSTPVGKSSAYTLTYSTQARTVPAATVAAVATTASTSSTPFGFAQAQADAIPVAINALAADVLALKKVIVALVADSQAVGIAG